MTRRSFRLLVLFSLSVCTLINVYAQQRPRSSGSTTAPRPTAAANHTVSSVPRASTVVDIGANVPTSLTIILALGESTIFRCPEEPLQLVFGDPTGFQVVEATEQSKRTEFYLIPTRANVSTNLWIELKSGPVSARLRTVAIKGGAKPTDYNSEVIVHATGYKEALSSANDKVKALEQELAELDTKTKADIAAAQSRSAILNDEINKKVLQTAFAFIATEARQSKRKPRQYGKAQSESLTAVQVTPLHVDPFGRSWVGVQLINTGKKDKTLPSVVIDRIDTNGDRILQPSQALPLTLALGQPIVVALMIEASQTPRPREVNEPLSITIGIAGRKTLTLPLEP